MSVLLENSNQTSINVSYLTSISHPIALSVNSNFVPVSTCISNLRIQHSTSSQIKDKTKLQGRGKWTKEQHATYVEFIRNNLDEMETKMMRKSRKVFLNMSKMVKTRTADQCRSHHQKILIYHKSLQDILRIYGDQIQPSCSQVMSHTQMKTPGITNADDSKQQVKMEHMAYQMIQNGNKIKIVIEDCLIQAFNFC